MDCFPFFFVPSKIREEVPPSSCQRGITDSKMARWNEILSLPVQNPPTLEFSASDIVRSKVGGWRDNLDRLALIPFARVDDFVRGESANKDCPTRFHVEARRRRPPQTSYKQKVDGILEYILYCCSFGPDDHRKGGIVRPSRTTYVPKKKNAGRPNTKRGYTCPFIVKRLISEPSVALIIYNQDKHVDKKRLPCHGPQDKKAEGTHAMFAPYISEDLRLRVLPLLYVGYVRRQERSIRCSTFQLDTDDAGIQTEWQLQQMIRFGNRSLVASDSRFGTNKMKYSVHSLVVFNSDNKAIPVAWIITPIFASADAHRSMRALYNRVHTKDPSWKLAGFIVDDPLTDILTIRWGIWRSFQILNLSKDLGLVRHAWLKNLIKRCMETELRVQISKRLGQTVDDICRGQATVGLFEVLVEDFVDGSSFMDYFKATCVLIGWLISWVQKCILTSGLMNTQEKDDFARYWKDEWVSGLTSRHKALKIPDSDVVMDGRCAKVTGQLDRDRVYVVWKPGSEFGICYCRWAEMGNLCEHVFEVIKLCHDRRCRKSSISIFQYKQALIDMLRCPPNDCLIRDHAVSLAVSVQRKLDGLVNLDSCQTNADTTWRKAVNSLEQLVVRGTNSSNQNRELVNENHHIDKDMSSPNENDCQKRDRHGLSRGVTGDFVEGVREESMDIDSSSNCTSLSRIRSVDDATQKQALNSLEQQRSLLRWILTHHPPVFLHLDYFVLVKLHLMKAQKNGDRIVNNAGSSTSKSPPSIDVLTDQDRQEHNSIMDVEPSSINIPPSGKGSMKQCAVTNQNNQNIACNKDPKPSVIDDEVKKPKGEGGSRSESHLCDDKPLNRVCDNKISNSNLCHDAKAADSLNSELLPSSSSIAGCIEEQPSGEVEIEEAASCKKPSLVH
ncbi:hypothetical protein POTOM_010319 [Populus tomentosa]|uniref:SWIM-type domain-containing protein n=1 Tax=Populus tomentosa TaxID=118781 RepID=A0A8X8A9V8_POPTO|nr:hypothetical protein POTOM_010319 [Populus tomentosa]